MVKKMVALSHISKNNYYHYLFFAYNSLFYNSLIFNGKKLRAFNLFIRFKYLLKREEAFDPFFTFLVAMMRLSPEFRLSALKLSGVLY